MIKTKMRKYQIEGGKFLLEGFNKFRGMYLADDTGIGKTIQGLYVIDKLAKKDDNFLIVAPVFAGAKWRDEIDKHLSKKRNYNLLISSYTALSDPGTLLHYTKNKFRASIFDESHYIKNYDSIRTQALLGAPWQRHRTIDSVSERVLWMSATPIPNRIGELYPFLKSINHKIIRDKTQEEFIFQWAEHAEFFRKHLTHRGVKNENLLKEALSDIMIRRLKDDVLDELPDFNRENIPVAIPKALEKLDKELARIARQNGSIFFSEDKDLIEAYVKNIPGFERYSEFRKKQGMYKIPFVLDYLKENILERNKKIVIWTYHQEVAEEYFNKLKTTNKILITGKVDPSKRFEILKKADEMSECILIATMHSIKETFDLTGFPMAFYTELDWTFSLFDQTEGRLRRIGQKDFVNYFYFIFEGGIESYMYEVYKDKRETVGKILPGAQDRKTRPRIIV
jgi:SNF2 family DNA or RNA helicase